MFKIKVSSVNSDAEFTTNNDNYVSWVSDIENEF